MISAIHDLWFEQQLKGSKLIGLCIFSLWRLTWESKNAVGGISDEPSTASFSIWGKRLLTLRFGFKCKKECNVRNRLVAEQIRTHSALNIWANTNSIDIHASLFQNPDFGEHFICKLMHSCTIWKPNYRLQTKHKHIKQNKRANWVHGYSGHEIQIIWNNTQDRKNFITIFHSRSSSNHFQAYS